MWYSPTNKDNSKLFASASWIMQDFSQFDVLNWFFKPKGEKKKQKTKRQKKKIWNKKLVHFKWTNYFYIVWLIRH